MVRQYNIHTNLDSSDNKIFDMTNGLIRFYEPSNLGLDVNSNIWTSQGVGVLGDSSISHPPIDFKLETFGNDLAENYKIFNEFINAIIKEKYVTLEYTSEMGTYFADIKLSTVSKTEGYGFNGTFSEKISFDPITMWYVYEQVKFNKVQNDELRDNSKIYKNKSKNYAKFNLEQHTKQLIDEDNKLIWGSFGNKTKTIAYEQTDIPDIPSIDVAVHMTQVTQGNSGWRSPNGANGGSYPVLAGEQYTISAYIKNNGTQDLVVDLQLGISANQDQSSPAYIKNQVTIPANSGWVRKTSTVTIPDGYSWAWSYIYSATPTVTADWSFAGYKVEKGSIATPWLPTASETLDSDYAQLNLLEGTKDFSRGVWANLDRWRKDGTYNGLDVMTLAGTANSGVYKDYTIPEDGDYTFSMYCKTTGIVGEFDIQVVGESATRINTSSKEFVRMSYTGTYTAGQIVRFYFRAQNNADAVDGALSMAGYKIEKGNFMTGWMPAEFDIPDDNSGYTYDYTYFGETNSERLSKWAIDDGIFSFVAKLYPEKDVKPNQEFGLRFLDKSLNEYTAFTFKEKTVPDVVQINTDINDEYYLKTTGAIVANAFAELNFGRFRTRIFKDGTMELIGVEMVEMNVKRRVEFV